MQHDAADRPARPVTEREAVTNPLAVLASGVRGAALWRWSMVLDMLGYYLLIVPLILFLRQWLYPT